MHVAIPPPFAARAVTGAPYSGELVTEQVQTLSDGTHIMHKSQPSKHYRDSLGRTRTERPMFPNAFNAPAAMAAAPTMIEITDPVAQFRYTLDTANKVAHRQALPAVPTARAGAMSAGSAAGPGAEAPQYAANAQRTAAETVRPEMKHESLGIRTIEGVEATGTRNTTTWPVGALGNDRPISRVAEIWMATQLKVMVLSKSLDPRFGEDTTTLTNINLGEPAMSLFQPPPDYSVVDEAGDFSIKWGTQR
jgi:hypothetical protein